MTGLFLHNSLQHFLACISTILELSDNDNTLIICKTLQVLNLSNLLAKCRLENFSTVYLLLLVRPSSELWKIRSLLLDPIPITRSCTVSIPRPPEAPCSMLKRNNFGAHTSNPICFLIHINHRTLSLVRHYHVAHRTKISRHIIVTLVLQT